MSLFGEANGGFGGPHILLEDQTMAVKTQCDIGGGQAIDTDKQQYSQLRISNLRKFDKFSRKHRQRKGTTFTCSSRSTYSFNNDINEEDEEPEDDVVSRVDIEEDHLGEIEDQLNANAVEQADELVQDPLLPTFYTGDFCRDPIDEESAYFLN